MEGGEWSAARPDRILPLGKTSYQFCRGWVDIRAGLNRRKISSQPVFDSGPSNPCSVAITTELPAHTRSVYWDLFQDCNGVKGTSVKISKTYKNKLLVRRKYMNLLSALILSSTNCCCKRKYEGKFVILLHCLNFSEVAFGYTAI